MAKVKHRSKKRGRPKGSKNKTGTKLINALKEVVEFAQGKDNGSKVWKAVDAKDGVHTIFEEPVPTVNIKSRLDECMMKFETAIAKAIVKLKESI